MTCEGIETHLVLHFPLLLSFQTLVIVLQPMLDSWRYVVEEAEVLYALGVLCETRCDRRNHVFAATEDEHAFAAVKL